MLTVGIRGDYYYDWGSIFVDRTVVSVYYSSGRDVTACSHRSDYGSVAGIGRCSAGCWRSSDLLLWTKKYRAPVRDL